MTKLDASEKALVWAQNQVGQHDSVCMKDHIETALSLIYTT